MIQRLPRLLLPLFLFAALLAAPSSVHAQSPAGGYTPSVVTGTGQLGPVISYYYNQISPSNHTVDFAVTGTAPTACTLSLDGSSDQTHWYSLSGSQSCTSSNMFHVDGKPVLYLRINILTYTAGDGTTQVTVHYTRGN